MVYKGSRLDCSYRLDIALGDLLLVEIKAVERLLPVHLAQVLTYLNLTQLPAAQLVNFNSVTLTTALRRLTRKQDLPFPPVNHEPAPSLVFGPALNPYQRAVVL